MPDLETDILQLRRREKDYLLRNDEKYVGMVADIAAALRAQIDTSPIAQTDKVMLSGLLADYERDFNALVAQNDRIEKLSGVMRKAAQDITPLVKQNVLDADRLAAEKRSGIAVATHERAQLNLIIVACALLLGVFFSFIITTRIVRPVREMAGLLDRLTEEVPSERIATVPGARDEINAMAESVNTLADNRATFVNWWKASMDEAIALRDLHEAASEKALEEANEELRAASLSQGSATQQHSGPDRQARGADRRGRKAAEAGRRQRHNRPRQGYAQGVGSAHPDAARGNRKMNRVLFG